MKRSNIFSLTLAHLNIIWTLVNMDDGHFSVTRLTHSYTKWTSLYRHLFSVHCFNCLIFSLSGWTTTRFKYARLAREFLLGQCSCRFKKYLWRNCFWQFHHHLTQKDLSLMVSENWFGVREKSVNFFYPDERQPWFRKWLVFLHCQHLTVIIADKCHGKQGCRKRIWKHRFLWECQVSVCRDRKYPCYETKSAENDGVWVQLTYSIMISLKPN